MTRAYTSWTWVGVATPGILSIPGSASDYAVYRHTQRPRRNAMPQWGFAPASPCEKRRLTRQGYPCPRSDWTPAVSGPLARAPICEGDLRSVEAVSLGFHAGMPAPVSAVNGSEDVFIEPRANQATPLLLFGFAIPRLEFSRQDNGESGAGAGHRRGLDDANRGIEDPATQVGEIRQCNHGRKLHDPFAFPVVVG